jgi:dihydrolipoamide dehydrogenase
MRKLFPKAALIFMSLVGAAGPHNQLRKDKQNNPTTLNTARTLADQYDVVVIGGGPGGYVAAIKSAQLGMKTACVEMRGKLGGTCLNVGCIPSKALLTSSYHYHNAKIHFADHGIVIHGNIIMDVGKMQDTKAKSVEGLTGGIEYLFQKYGVDYYIGKGTITGPNSVEVTLNEGGSESLDSQNIIIATGSEVTPLPEVPVNNEGGKIVDSTGALEISKVPKKMAIIGGGAIGLEMGSIWSRLGAEVTVIEILDRICPSMDTELTKQFQTTLKKQGFKFKTKTKVVKSEVTRGGVILTTEPSSKGGDATEETYEIVLAEEPFKKKKDRNTKQEIYDIVLVAIGRHPYTEGLGLEDVGIQTDKFGCIEVDTHFKTAVPSIYAIGDAIKGPMLAHKAEAEGIACVETIAGYASNVNYNVIPLVIYTYPEVASVGKTEEELKEAGVAYNIGNFPFSANSRARTNGSTERKIMIRF